MPALVTPFHPDESLDLEAHTANVASLWERGVEGVVIAGSNGEGPYLEPGERAALAAAARRAAPDAFVLVGVGAESLRGARAMCAEAAAAEADGVLVLTPATLVRSRPDLIEGFFDDLADVAPLPVYLYSVPKVTGVELPVEAAVRLSAHRNVAGMKDSGGVPERCVAIANGAPAGFAMFAGASAAVSAAVAGGCHGAITASANYAPTLVAEVIATAGRPDAAAAHERLLRLSGEVERFGVAGVKYAAGRTGLRGGHLRRPLRPLSAEAAAAIDAAIDAARVEPV